MAQSTATPPRRFRRLIERVCAQDRRYFEQHPAARSYVRECVPGEAWPALLPPVTRIRVTLIAPGIRAREALTERSKEG